ncbi:MAG: flagellar M-ring protein FliF [Spirochaetales bacterium]|nr:flagellar M-ring protein FliF [Spirochaetales bacterium]
MKDWFKNFFTQIKTVWGKWSGVQKIVFIGILAVAIIAIVLLLTISSKPTSVPLLTTAITDEDKLFNISSRLDQEGVSHTTTADGRIMVKDAATARRMVSILTREDLLPSDVSPWDVFKMDRWTVTDFEREVKLREAVTENLKLHIEALDDVDNARVTLVLPEKELFVEDQDPVTASVIITPKPGSDILGNRKKIEGIVKLVKLAIQGLQDENIVITDHQGNVLNDFAGLADFDMLELTKRQMKQKEDLERQYKNEVLKELMAIFGADRVRILKVDIALDMSKKTVETAEFYPITLTADNPSTPYDETKVIPNVPRSEQQIDEKFEGTGFNPEGPPGQEGQTPPAYKDLEGLVGHYTNESRTTNYEVNERKIFEEKSPWEIKRITIGVAVDGVWKWVYGDKGTPEFDTDGSIVREYKSVSDEELAKAKTLIEHAIGYDRLRGDSVTVQHMQFDRTEQFQQEDQQFRNRKKMQQTILYSVIGLGFVLVAFFVFRLISRAVERKRRLREEELSRQHQAMREAALRSAEEEAVEVQMSVEERARLEMQENAINMAREHPEDVAQLIRTWLVEE